MSYIGNTPSQQAFAPAVDYFNGNASTVAFTLSRPVASVAQVQVTIENVPQNPSSSFTVSGSTITFTSAPPSGTSNIYVTYTSPITTVIAPGQGTVNTTQLGASLLVPTTSGGTGSASTTYCSLTANVTGILPSANGGTGSASGVSNKIQPITASAASSALTITLSPTVLDFRSATIGDGTVTTVSNSTSISVVVPSTATLGTVNAVQSRLVVLAINNAGTMELAVTNISGGSALDETGVISTTLIAAASNSATLYYSTTARTSVAYRVVGYVESTQATAGTWATAPSTLQGYGGQALAAMSSLGYGQTWQNLYASRAVGTTYYNTTGKPIALNYVAAMGTIYSKMAITVDGVLITGSQSTVLGADSILFAVVQPSKSWVISAIGGGSVTLSATGVVELR